MESELRLAEDTLVGLRSHTDTCRNELHQVENQLRSRHAELQRQLADVSLQTEIPSHKVRITASS